MPIWGVEQAASRLRRGRRQLNHAKYLHGIDSQFHGEAEAKARTALATLRSAMDWLEGTDQFDAAHQALDDAGSWVCRTFKCRLEQRGESYFQSCPVALAHNRIGFSAVCTEDRVECSICGQDPEDCDHISGQEHDGKRCQQVVRQGEIIGVGLVGLPRMPDARLPSARVSTEQLQAQLGGQGWCVGMPVRCSRCLLPCDGVTTHPGLGH